MSVNINGEKFTTFADYINDESKVSKVDKAQIEFEAALIGKLVEARESKYTRTFETQIQPELLKHK